MSRWQLRELDDGDLAWFCGRCSAREFSESALI
jgi:hypothetical protein